MGGSSGGTPSTSTGLVLADFDQDGHLDLASGGLEIRPGNGDGSFGAPTLRTTTGRVEHAVDHNGDGTPDLVTLALEDRAFSVTRNVTFLDACHRGTVNAGAGAGAIADTLFVNGSAGYQADRKIVVGADEPFELFMDSPPATSSSRYALYVWLREPETTNVVRLPAGLGRSCLKMPLSPGRPRPVRTWNNTGKDSLGEADFPSSPTPWVVLDAPAGVGITGTAFFQGLIEDPASASRKPGSVTNGVKVLFR